MATVKGDAHDIGKDQALDDHQRQGFSRVDR
jgi:methanogenic corrinoid protein MtbC1